MHRFYHSFRFYHTCQTSLASHSDDAWFRRIFPIDERTACLLILRITCSECVCVRGYFGKLMRNGQSAGTLITSAWTIFQQSAGISASMKWSTYYRLTCRNQIARPRLCGWLWVRSAQDYYVYLSPHRFEYVLIISQPGIGGHRQMFRHYIATVTIWHCGQ